MAQQPQQQLLAFTAEWLDPSNGVLWRYQLLFWPGDPGEVELVRCCGACERINGSTPPSDQQAAAHS